MKQSSEKLRLSKLMSQRGLCSRREADAFITKGWVRVNGEVCSELGTKVEPTAIVELMPSAKKETDKKVTILLNKPLGYLSSPSDDNYPEALDLITAESQYRDNDTIQFTRKQKDSLAPAGRLDIDSTGLMVFTQDGRVAKLLIGQDSPVEKEYLVKVDGKITGDVLSRLCHGLELDNRKLKPAKVTKAGTGRLRFILKEGRKRQIRRMCELVDLKVISLKRVRVGRVSLGALRPGQWRYLKPDEQF